MLLPYIVIVVLIIGYIYLLIRFFELRAKHIEIKRELNAQSLDYHLNKIHEAGYEYTIRHRKESKGHSKRTPTKGKNKKRTFDEIVTP